VPPLPLPGRSRKRKRALPDTPRGQLDLLDERRFQSGVVHVHYRVTA
jgi:hypothetical protein